MEPELCAPCKLQTNEDGTYTLLFDDFDATKPIFSDVGFEGGGFSWYGVVVSLLEMKEPELIEKVGFHPEASLLTASGSDLDALKRVADLIREAIQTPVLLREAITKADPEQMV